MTLTNGNMLGNIQPHYFLVLLESGDIITEIDGKAIKNSTDIYRVLGERQIGDEVTVKALRILWPNNNIGSQRSAQKLSYSLKLMEH